MNHSISGTEPNGAFQGPDRTWKAPFLMNSILKRKDLHQALDHSVPVANRRQRFQSGPFVKPSRHGPFRRITGSAGKKPVHCHGQSELLKYAATAALDRRRRFFDNRQVLTARPSSSAAGAATCGPTAAAPLPAEEARPTPEPREGLRRQTRRADRGRAKSNPPIGGGGGERLRRQTVHRKNSRPIRLRPCSTIWAAGRWKG